MEAAKPFGNSADRFTEFIPQPDITKGIHIIVPITSDKGLCGGANSGICKLARLIIEERKQTGVQSKIFTVGDKAPQILKRTHGENFIASTQGVVKKPFNFLGASRIAEQFSEREHDVVTILYNHYKNVASYSPIVKNIGSWNWFAANTDKFATYDADKDTVRSLQEFHLATMLTRVVTESGAVELAARMNAMESATKNANEMLSKLTILYNRSRQDKITTELVEIISGAAALSEAQ